MARGQWAETGMGALVLVAVSFDAFIAPLAARFRRGAHRRPA